MRAWLTGDPIGSAAGVVLASIGARAPRHMKKCTLSSRAVGIAFTIPAWNGTSLLSEGLLARIFAKADPSGPSRTRRPSRRPHRRRITDCRPGRGAGPGPPASGWLKRALAIGGRLDGAPRLWP